MEFCSARRWHWWASLPTRATAEPGSESVARLTSSLRGRWPRAKEPCGCGGCEDLSLSHSYRVFGMNRRSRRLPSSRPHAREQVGTRTGHEGHLHDDEPAYQKEISPRPRLGTARRGCRGVGLRVSARRDTDRAGDGLPGSRGCAPAHQPTAARPPAREVGTRDGGEERGRVRQMESRGSGRRRGRAAIRHHAGVRDMSAAGVPFRIAGSELCRFAAVRPTEVSARPSSRSIGRGHAFPSRCTTILPEVAQHESVTLDKQAFPALPASASPDRSPSHPACPGPAPFGRPRLTTTTSNGAGSARKAYGVPPFLGRAGGLTVIMRQGR